MKLYDAGATILIVFVIISLIAAGASYKLLGPDSVITKDLETVLEVEGETLIHKEESIVLPVDSNVPQAEVSATVAPNQEVANGN